jgi:hypothetical protein
MINPLFYLCFQNGLELIKYSAEKRKGNDINTKIVVISGTDDDVVLEVKSTGISLKNGSGDLDTFSGGKVGLDEIKGCFKTLPVCGDSANTITVTLEANTDGTVIVSTECSAKDGNTPIHVLDQKS